MPNDPNKLLTLIIAGAGFGLVLSLWLLGILLWSTKRARRARQVEERLNQNIPGLSQAGQGRVLRLWHEGREATTVVPWMTKKGGPLASLEKLRKDAGWEAPLGSAMLGLLVLLAMVSAATFLITTSVIVSLMSPAATLLVIWIYINQRVARRVSKFERQLIDALELAARSLRVGHPLVGAFRLIAEEIPAPIGDLFGGVCQQQAMGVAMDEALRGAADSTTSDDLKLFATSVVIQLRSGGNLADMMERVAKVIRERDRLARRVRVLTTQTQFSKRVLLAMPFFIFVLLNVMNPAYMRPLYTTATGQMIMIGACTGLLLGWFTMNWISKLSL